jgi:hypothetical protein
LAGASLKLELDVETFPATVRHVRGDDPTAPTTIRFYIDAEERTVEALPRVRPVGCTCSAEHVELRPEDVVEILEPAADQ